MSSEKQTVIVEVRASDVRDTDEWLWTAQPPTWEAVRDVQASALGMVNVYGDRGLLSSEDRDRPVLVRRPVPSGADALREALELVRELSEHEDAPCNLDHKGGCQEHGWYPTAAGEECVIPRARRLLAAAPTAAPAAASSGVEGGEDQCSCAYGQKLPHRHQPGDSPDSCPLVAAAEPRQWTSADMPCDRCKGRRFVMGGLGGGEIPCPYCHASGSQPVPPASAGTEGEREAERFRRAINLLRATADHRREIATNDLSRPADARSRAASAAREFTDAADVLAAAPAPAVTDSEGDEHGMRLALIEAWLDGDGTHTDAAQEHAENYADGVIADARDAVADADPEGEAVGPIGPGTPHARMEATWERLRERAEFIAEWSDYVPVMSDLRGAIEYQAIVALDRLAARVAPAPSVSKEGDA